jgi:hypothetical protein
LKSKYFIFLILLLSFVIFGCSQKKAKSIPINSSEDSLSIYFSLANDLNQPLQNRQENNHKAFEIVVNHENDSLNRVNLFKVANRYYNINNLKDFNKTVHLVLQKSEKVKDTLHITKAYNYLGDYYDSQGVLNLGIILT